MSGTSIDSRFCLLKLIFEIQLNIEQGAFIHPWHKQNLIFQKLKIHYSISIFYACEYTKYMKIIQGVFDTPEHIC